jgi:DNA-binding response OmpR family regulator
MIDIILQTTILQLARLITKGEFAVDQPDTLLNNQHRCVLIVEDEMQNLKIMSDICTMAGLQAFKAQSVAEARAFLEKDEVVSLLLLDLNLPDGSGLLLVEPFRRKYQGIIIFLVTAAATYENVKMAMDLGVSKVIGKPFKVKQLLQEIEFFTGWNIAEQDS